MTSSRAAGGDDLYHAVFEASAVAMALVTLEGTLLRANSALCMLVRREEPELIEQGLGALVGPADMAPVLAQIRATESRPARFEAHLRHHDGSLVPVQVTACPLSGVAGAAPTLLLQCEARALPCALPDTAADILNAMSEVAMVLGPDLTILAASPGLARSLGRPLENLIGTPALSHLPPDLAASRGAQLTAVLCSGRAVHFEDEKAGRFFDNSIYPVLDERGQVTRMALFCREITVQRRAERDALEQTQTLDSILAASPVGIALVRGRNLVWANQAMADMTGQTLEDHMNTAPHILYADDEEYERVGRALYQGPTEDGTRSTDTTWVRSDGSTIQVHLQARPLVLDDHTQGHIITVTDITERLRHERELQASLERYRGLYDALPGGVMVYDAAGMIVEASDAACELMGIPRTAFLGPARPSSHFRAIHEDGSPFIDEDRPSAVTLRTGERVRNAVAGLWRADLGQYVWVLINSEPRLDPATGQVEAAVVTLVDITDVKRAESALQRSEHRFREMADLLPDMLFELDPQLSFIYTNQTVSEVMGYTPNDRDMQLADVMDAATLARAAEDLATATASGRSFIGVYDIRRKDGRVLPIEVHALRITSPDGQLIGYRGVARDITDRRRAEAERLAAIGQLAAGVAHEFNNMLAALRLKAEDAAEARTPHEYGELTELVLYSVQHGREVCRGLNTLARPREPERQPLQLETVLEGVLLLAGGPLGGGGIRVERDYQAQGLYVHADAGQLEQVFLNLVINACHAMPEGGQLTLRTERVQPAGEAAQIVTRISDTGRGIEPQHLNRIFEPYFTTKGWFGDEGTVAGTGLGLTVTLGIVQAHAGTIEVQSTVGVGTTFTVALPEYDGPVEAPAVAEETVPPPPPLPPVTSRRVLVAEDYRGLANYMRAVLVSAGHEVVVVRNTPAALVAMREQAFDLVVTDLVMPGGGGRAVLAEAATMAAAPRVLVITGLLEDEVEQEVLSMGAAGCLRKPFTRAELAQAVHAVLAGHTP